MEHYQAIVVITLLAWAADSVSGTTHELSTTTGDTVNIPCLFGEGMLLYIHVLWYYNDGSGAHNILKLDKGELNIAAEYANRASLHDDYSTLILKEITVADGGTFHCVVHRLGQTTVPHFTTKLNVFSLRPDTLPVISYCTRVDEFSSCSIHANQSFTLTCTLPNVYPVEDSELIWYQDGKGVSSTPDVTQNDDGTTDISRQIQVSKTGNFSCNATYISANGRVNTAVSVEACILPPANVTNTTDKNLTDGAIAWKAISILIVLIVGILLCIYCLKRRSKCCFKKDEQNSQVARSLHVSTEELTPLKTSARDGFKDGNAESLEPSEQPTTDANRSIHEEAESSEPSEQPTTDANRLIHEEAESLEPSEQPTTDAYRSIHEEAESSEPSEQPTTDANRSIHEEVDNANPPSSSTVTQEGHVNRSDERRVTDGEIVKLSKLVPGDNYTVLCVELGYDITLSNNILSKCQSNYSAALEDILKKWSTKTSGFIHILDEALDAAELGGLKIQYKM